MTAEKQFRNALIALPVFIVPLPLFLAYEYFFLIAPLRVQPDWTLTATVMHLFQWFRPLGLGPILRVIGLGTGFWAAAQGVRVLLYFILRKTRWASAA